MEFPNGNLYQDLGYMLDTHLVMLEVLLFNTSTELAIDEYFDLDKI